MTPSFPPVHGGIKRGRNLFEKTRNHNLAVQKLDREGVAGDIKADDP
jgi:hypothetical protein